MIQALKRAGELATALFLALFLIGGWGMAAHAQVCDNANCMIQLQEASDPAYQAAIHSSWPYEYGYSYPYHYSYPYSSYPYVAYSSWQPYFLYPQPNSYWQSGCLITTIQMNGVVQTTRACGD